jgi:hypothetical protein
MDGDVKVLLETVEESFGVKFRSGELADDSYLSDLCSAVRSHITYRASERCFTSIVFWRLRRACIELFSASKGSIAPSTPTDIILPAVRRRRAWLELSATTGLKLPGLEYSTFLSYTIFWGACVLPAIMLFMRLSWWSVLAATLLWPISATMLFHFLKPLADQLPAQSRTFGDLSKTAVGLNYGMLARELGTSSESEMLDALRHVIADLIDVDPRALVGENPRLIDLALANDGFRAQV